MYEERMIRDCEEQLQRLRDENVAELNRMSKFRKFWFWFFVACTALLELMVVLNVRDN